MPDPFLWPWYQLLWASSSFALNLFTSRIAVPRSDSILGTVGLCWKSTFGPTQGARNHIKNLMSQSFKFQASFSLLVQTQFMNPVHLIVCHSATKQHWAIQHHLQWGMQTHASELLEDQVLIYFTYFHCRATTPKEHCKGSLLSHLWYLCLFLEWLLEIYLVWQLTST